MSIWFLILRSWRSSKYNLLWC